MLRPYLRSLAVVLIALFLGDAFLGDNARANESSDLKFQRDLESLLGASVPTKHGQMSIRQSKDAEGRVRKQIIVGPGFSEIQLDQNGDGTVDFWEVSQGNKTVVASEPNRGRFLRLAVTDRSSRGIHESIYLLDLNSRSYNLLKRSFTGKSVRYNVSAVGEFEADDAPKVIVAETVPGAEAVGSGNARFDLQEAAWIEHQTNILGPELLCEKSDSAANRLAALQRDWWKILKRDADDKTDRLTSMIRDSRMFSESCKKPAHAKDFEALTKSVANVMMSSSKGEPLLTDKTRGRYLRCLEQSGLGVTAARMEKSFWSGLKDPNRTETMIKCDWKPGQAGRSVPAQTNPYLQQVTVQMCHTEDGKGKTADGSPLNYANVMFHEMMHVAGVVDEKLVHAAQACCGDPTDNRPGACAKLDQIVGESRRYNELETHMSRVSDQTLSFISQLENDFGSEVANSLYKAYLVGLDNYKKGKPPEGEFESGLVSDVEYAKCRAENGEEFCKTKWRNAIQDFTNSFFPKGCRKIAPGASKKACRAFSKEITESVAAAIEKSLIDNPQQYAANPAHGSAVPSVPGACPEPVKRRSGILKDVGFNQWSFMRGLGYFARNILGDAVQADPADCEDAIGVRPAPPVTTPGGTIPRATSEPVADPGEAPPMRYGNSSELGGMSPSRVTVPGGALVDDASQTSNRPTDSVSPSTPRPTRGGSSLPVTRVESASSSRTFAESRYRRATDFIGNSTRGLDKIRSAILPSAVAAESSAAASRSRVRLGPKDQFVAFNPAEGEKVTAKLENPFATNRSIASLDVASLIRPIAAAGGAAGGSVGGVTSVEGGSASARSRQADSPIKGEKNAGGRSGNSGGGTNAVTRSISSSGGGAAMQMSNNAVNVAGLSKPQRDLLAGLFTLPYRQIAPRLKQLDVVEALIAGRISVQDAQGRVLGSSRPVTRYLYVGSNQPLRLKSEKE